MKRHISRVALILPVVLLLLPFLLGMRPPQDRGKPSKLVKIGKDGVRTILSSPRNSREYKPGELLVRFKSGTAANKISALQSRLGTRTLIESRMIPRLQIVKLPRRMSVEAAIKQFKTSGLVQYAEPNWKRYAQGVITYPNDPFVQILPNADPLCDGNTDTVGHETDMWDLQMINGCTSLDFLCASGHTCGGNNKANSDVSVLPCTDGDCSVNEPLGAFTDVPATITSDIIVMSVDSGVDYTFPDIAPNMWRNPGEVAGNGLDDDQNGIVDDVYGLNAVGLGAEGPGCGANNDFGDPMDDFFHGSHTTGTMIARANNFAGLIGMAGLSNHVKVLGCKFLDAQGSGFTGDAIKCFEYAYDMKINHGQNIVASNNSWGGGPSSQSLEDAIAAQRDAGILTVFSAGNSLSDNDVFDTFPTNMNVDNMIRVGAYNQQDCASGFSNFGSRSVDVFAPGTAILSACPWNTENCSGDPNFQYAYANGTSMAAPHVTGLAAMLFAINPALTPAQVKNIILTTGVGSSKDDSTCDGIPSGDDIDNVTSSYYYPTFQSFTGDGTEANKKSVTDKRIGALRAAQVAASPAATPGD